MKKNSLVLLIAVCILFLTGCTYFPTKSEPGLYVNDWPVFSVSYPPNWMEKTPDLPNFSFRAEVPQGFPSLRILVAPNMGMPMEFTIKTFIPEMSKKGKEIKVEYEKGTKLKDGAAAYEAEIEWICNGIKQNTFILTAQRDMLWISIIISDTKGKIDDDLREIAYSLKIKSGEEKLVNIPADIQEFLDQFSKDMVSHNVAKVMLHYSDQFRQNGIGKLDVETIFKKIIFGITSYQPNVTKFELKENKADLAGFIVIGGTARFPFKDCLIKENGQWKFYGNQKQKQM